MVWVKRILSGLFVLAVVLLLLYAYRNFLRSTREGGEAMKAVPPSAGLVLRTGNVGELWDQLQETNIMWENLVKEGVLQRVDPLLTHFDTLVRQDERLRPLVSDDATFLISLHSVGSRSVGPQITVGLPGSASPDEVLEGLREVADKVRERNYEEELIYETGPEGDRSAFALLDRTLILSPSVILVEDAVRHMKNGDGIADRSGYQKVNATTGSGMDGNVFIHYPTAERLLAKFLKPSAADRLKDKGDMALWAGMDLLLRSRSLLLTGFTDTGGEEAEISKPPPAGRDGTTFGVAGNCYLQGSDRPYFPEREDRSNNMLKRLLIFLVLNFGALAIGGFFMGEGPQSDWYEGLNKAPWTPPGWTFGAAWSTIMLCFSVYMAMLWPKVEDLKLLSGLYGFQLLLNIGWNPAFFYFHLPLLAFLIIIGLTLLVAFILFFYWSELRVLSLLLLPYLLWLIVATSLNGYIVGSN